MNQLTTTVNQDDRERLIHMLYDAVVDNSLWPEMISELIDHIDSQSSTHALSAQYVSGLTEHFERAFQLSEHIVDLQERSSTLAGVLDSISVGISLYDHADQLVYANQFAQQNTPAISTPLKKLKKLSTDNTNTNSTQHSYVNTDQEVLPACTLKDTDNNQNVAIISTQHIQSVSLPKNIATMVLHYPKQSETTLEHMKRTYYLTNAEMDFLSVLYKIRNLKKAALLAGLTYETARTYIKRIFVKTEVNGQSELFNLMDSNPLSWVQLIDSQSTKTNKIRRQIRLNDGRTLEYFSLGPESGKVVLHFDALTGVAIDALGSPDRYLPVLETLNLRIITPCRPGTFRSDFKPLKGLREYTSDWIELCDHLSVSSVVALSQAFGSCAALAFAATAPQYVEKLVLCAPSYPMYQPENWHQMDIFYIISGVIGRRVPQLMDAIVPFLMRSVMQNTGKYLERHIHRSKCQADIDVLSSPTIRQRIPEMLGERTAMGFKGLVQENHLNTHGWDFDVSKITCLTYILQGGLDNVSAPEGAMALAKRIPNAHLHMFDELGQYLIFTEWPWILELCAGKTPSELKQKLLS